MCSRRRTRRWSRRWCGCSEPRADARVRESLTGGGVGARITSVPGSSEVFLGSAVVYALSAKVAILGVSQETLDGPGPVSEACAREMATGTRRVFGSDLGLSLTGAAGPEPRRRGAGCDLGRAGG